MLESSVKFVIVSKYPYYSHPYQNIRTIEQSLTAFSPSTDEAYDTEEDAEDTDGGRDSVVSTRVGTPHPGRGQGEGGDGDSLVGSCQEMSLEGGAGVRVNVVPPVAS